MLSLCNICGAGDGMAHFIVSISQQYLEENIIEAQFVTVTVMCNERDLILFHHLIKKYQNRESRERAASWHRKYLSRKFARVPWHHAKKM
jgi:hypothetical protein